ncbi:fumarylacetoacetate hydrolase family protein [Mycolicibacterium septicum]|uniref:fumarylacetoacetate hydrolase family protein n=1 Tax=Mycolicibacterium septicum TaxID=98668 RepID=UPI00235EA5E1|nr:fumarylacetoacetate hydrolase family protein [Mycolicibacterium septicum]
MRLATYDNGFGPRPGLQQHDGADLVDVAALVAMLRPNGIDPPGSDITALLKGGTDLAARLLELSARHEDQLRARSAIHSVESVTLLPPVLRPEKIICIAVNFYDHAEETGLPVPKEPMFFAKFANSLIGHGATITPPAMTAQVDYEAELAVVIGKRGTNIPAEQALNHIAGVMPFNDVSARDLQLANQLWTGGKAIDTFAPAGPAVVLLDEINDFQNLPMKTRVNGNVVQDSSTAKMIFSVPELIAYLSRIMTLVPGDVIATGTPAGVASAHGPMTFLQTGDSVEIEIGGVGLLRNPIGAPVSAIPQSQVAGAAS